MFLRLRWMIIGMLIAAGASAAAVVRLARARRRLTPAAVSRAAAGVAADGLTWTARRLRGAATPQG